MKRGGLKKWVIRKSRAKALRLPFDQLGIGIVDVLEETTGPACAPSRPR